MTDAAFDNTLDSRIADHGFDPPRHFVNAPGWTDERVSLLKKLYAEGLPFSQIAAALGFVSRNSVIGKAHRLGLELRGPGGNYNGNQRTKPGPKPRYRDENAEPKPRPAVQFRPKPRHESPEIKAMRCAEVVELRISLDELTHSNCHWPSGNGPYTFCGNAALKGYSYCEPHHALAHLPTKRLSA